MIISMTNRFKWLLPAVAFLGQIQLSLMGEAGDIRPVASLSQAWKIQPATSPDTPPDESNWGSTISGSWKDQGGLQRQNTSWKSANSQKINSLWFEKEFSVPADWKGKEIVADFRRLEGDSIVFVNGNRVGELLRPGGEVILTNLITYGDKNKLRVFMTRDYTGISRKYEQDPLRYYIRSQQKMPMNEWGLGITAPVTVMARSRQAIIDVFAIPSWRKKELALQVETVTDQALPNGVLEATVLDSSRKPVLTLKSAAPGITKGKGVQTLKAPWENPSLWELERPYLYTVEVTLKAGDKVIDVYPSVTFGFREIWTEGNKLMMNGHLSRWRLAEVYGANQYGISLYQLIGYNVGQIQPHRLMWWSNWAETPMLDENLLTAMDRTGMGCTAPAPSVGLLRTDFNKHGAAEDFKREMDYYLRKYRNHPCILAWVVGMNSYCPTSNMTPEGMGVREESPKGQGAIINAVTEMARGIDPTRLTFSHADGSTGDISTSNLYLNFVPLQEREEWPMAWAAKANMPYCAVEFGAPFAGNYWKGKQFLLTEYLSMYLGDNSYLSETDEGLKKTVDYALTAAGRGFGDWINVDRNQYPAYWEFSRLFVKNTNRSWRTWGVNAGWLYFIIDERYGNPKKKTVLRRYEELNYNFLDAPLKEKPAWANPNFDIFSEANKTLLVYIAGSPVHTDKTHAFYAGETIKKQIAAVWDGSEPASIQAEWTLKMGPQAIASGKENLQLKPGEIRFVPISAELPKDVKERTSCSLEMTYTQDGKSTGSDGFSLEVFPQTKSVTTTARIALFDPLKKSSVGLKELGVNATEWKPGDSLKDVDVLILGRESLQPGGKLPYQPTDIANGLRVIVLEQTPETWQSLGFETTEAMPRYVFVRDRNHPIFKGLQPEDLINWRGTPDLLPEGKQALVYDSPHAMKWTNRHAVASVALKTPHITGFTPLLEAEFDLAYSPLLEWRSGKGAVYFCTLDLTGRLKVDPAATLLAKNLIETLPTAPMSPTKRVFYVGRPEVEESVRRMGVEITTGMPKGEPSDSILVIGQSAGNTSSEVLDAFVRKGGTLLYLNLDEKELQAKGFRTERKTFQRCNLDVVPDWLRSVGPGLLRWQDTIEVVSFAREGQPGQIQVLADGALLDRKLDKGREVFVQLTPSLLADRYGDNAEKREAIQLSVLRLHRLVTQILTNLGAGSSGKVAQRLAVSTKAPSVNAMGSWKLLGPYKNEGAKGGAILNESYPPQYDALRGAENPNVTYRRDDGVMLDWRKTVDAGSDGYVDLAKALNVNGKGNLAYVTRNIDSDKDQQVTLHLGVDYWMQVWVNGTSVIKVDEAHGMPAPNSHTINVPLKKGKNIITIKLASGNNGFGFWCRLKVGADDGSEASRSTVNFYIPLFHPFDPYRYTYW